MSRNWKCKKLIDVCQIARGGSPRPITDYLTNDSNGINWIKIGDAIDGDKYIRSTKEKIKPEGMSKSRFVHKGDFILSNSMSFGRPYILDIDGCIHDGWLVLQDANNQYIKDFLYYLLSSPWMYAKFKALAVGGVVNNLNSKLVGNVMVPVPPIDVQQSIVSELDEINNLLSLKQKELETYDKLAQSLFYEMFGDPVENEKGWEVKKLGEVCVIITGSTPSTSDGSNWDGHVNWVTPAELDSQLYYGETKRKITEKAAKSLTIMPKGTVLLSTRAPIGKLAITTVPMCCNQGFKNMICKDELVNIFLYYYLLFTMDNIKAMGRGATFKEVSKNAINEYSVVLPPLSLQQLFATRIEAIEAQKANVKAAIEKLETLLAARMQYWFE